MSYYATPLMQCSCYVFMLCYPSHAVLMLCVHAMLPLSCSAHAMCSCYATPLMQCSCYVCMLCVHAMCSCYVFMLYCHAMCSCYLCLPLMQCAVPYLKVKLDRLFSRLQEEDDQLSIGWWSGSLKYTYFSLYPYLSALWQVLSSCYLSCYE